MKSIEQIMAIGQPDEIYRQLTKYKKDFHISFDETEHQYNPEHHRVMDKNVRKNKRVKEYTGKTDPNTGEKLYKEKLVERCRIALPIQKVLVERTVGFLFSIPVKYEITNAHISEQQSQLLDSILHIFHENKIKYFDKKLARTLFRERECAELWYFTLDEKGKPDSMRVKLLSPSHGDKLYPHYDSYDRMDGFAREYKQYDDNDVLRTHFDVYTKNHVYHYIADGSTYMLAEAPRQHGFGKVPVVYYRQEETEWNSVQPVIERVEDLLSNWGDTNDYFGTPKYYVKGKLVGFAEKGEVGQVYQGEANTDMSVLSWDSSPNSISGELAQLQNTIFSYTQTPDVSFENMKSLGNNTSGAAIRLMFTDPHMKAQVKIELFGEMFTRRFNVVKGGYTTSIAPIPSSVSDNMEVEPQFTPYIPQNDKETVEMLSTATGGKAILSQQEAIRQNPQVSNPEDCYKQIQEEANIQAAANLISNGFEE